MYILLLSCLSHLPNIFADEVTLNQKVILKIEKVLKNMKKTSYTHITDIDEQKGRYYLDCSGLAFYLLRKTAPVSLANVPIREGKVRPQAVCFHTIFSKSPKKKSVNGWLSIPHLIDAEPGDFIAWRKMIISEKGDTGHIVVVMEKPVLEEDGKIMVKILDSAKSGHSSDSRTSQITGIGTGTIWFNVNKKGEPVSYYWSSKSINPKSLPIAIGRPIIVPKAK